MSLKIITLKPERLSLRRRRQLHYLIAIDTPPCLRLTGRPASATARLLAEGDATAEVIDLRYPVRRRDERSEADRRRAGFPSY